MSAEPSKTNLSNAFAGVNENPQLSIGFFPSKMDALLEILSHFTNLYFFFKIYS